METERKESYNKNREIFGEKAQCFSESFPSVVNTNVFWGEKCILTETGL